MCVSILASNPRNVVRGPITQKPKPPQGQRVCKGLGHRLPAPTRVIPRGLLTRPPTPSRARAPGTNPGTVTAYHPTAPPPQGLTHSYPASYPDPGQARWSRSPPRGNIAASTGPRVGGFLRPRDGRGGSARDGAEEGGGVHGVGGGGEAEVAGVNDGHGTEVDGGEDKRSCHHRVVGDCSHERVSRGGLEAETNGELDQAGGSDLSPPQQDQRQRYHNLPRLCSSTLLQG